MKGTVHVQETFLRGDTNGDGKTDISDAIATLNVLFVGNPFPCCRDALDANDDGALDISDAVFTLTFLFVGGAKMPPPYPRAGADRTEDKLLCCPP